MTNPSLYFVYVDEAGDDGQPGASPLFVVSALYFRYEVWGNLLDKTLVFRRRLREVFGIPVRYELHTRPLLRLKKPFSALSHVTAQQILFGFCSFLASLPVRSVHVVIHKKTRVERPILDTAFTFVAQRIANDLLKIHEQNKALIITDAGREASMRKILRRLRRYNPVPSRKENKFRDLPLSLFLEDPLAKQSHQSYFLQMVDCLATVVYLYAQTQYYPREIPLPKRIRKTLESASQKSAKEVILDLMQTLQPVFNTSASRHDPYGMLYPYSPKTKSRF